MRKMTNIKKRLIETEIEVMMRSVASSEYAEYILEHENEETKSTFMEDVIDDVMCASAWNEEEYYNINDIRLAIGRVLIDRLGIEY